MPIGHAVGYLTLPSTGMLFPPKTPIVEDRLMANKMLSKIQTIVDGERSISILVVGVLYPAAGTYSNGGVGDQDGGKAAVS